MYVYTIDWYRLAYRYNRALSASYRIQYRQLAPILQRGCRFTLSYRRDPCFFFLFSKKWVSWSVYETYLFCNVVSEVGKEVPCTRKTLIVLMNCQGSCVEYRFFIFASSYRKLFFKDYFGANSLTYWKFKISMRHYRPQRIPIIMADRSIHLLTLTYGNSILFCQ